MSQPRSAKARSTDSGASEIVTPVTSGNGRMVISLGELVVRPLKMAETVARDVVNDIVRFIEWR